LSDGHQHQHGEGEERQVGEEPRTVRVMVHVADRVDVNQAGHGVDDNQHHCGQRVDPECPVDAEPARVHPAHDRHAHHFTVAHGNREEGHPGQERGDDQEQRGDVFRGLGADGAATETRDQRADEGKKDDSVVHGSLSPSSC
jgi:hypothetical protein